MLASLAMFLTQEFPRTEDEIFMKYFLLMLLVAMSFQSFGQIKTGGGIFEPFLRREYLSTSLGEAQC
jgi:hypothetical protein